VTQDPWADVVNGPDGGWDAGLLRFGPGLEPLPVSQGPGGFDPCGVLLLAGTAHQDPWHLLDEGNGTFAVAALETSFETFHIRRPFLGRFDRTGAMLMSQGLAFPALPGTIGFGVAAAPDGAGGYFILWEDDVPPLYNRGDVVVRRVDADGAPLWDAPVRLSLELTSFPLTHAIVADGHGGAYIAWEETRFITPPLGTRTWVQHVTADGTLAFGPVGIPLLDGAPAVQPAALVPVGHDVIAVTGVGGTIRAIRLAPDGSMPWGPAGVQVGSWIHALDDLRVFDIGNGSFYVLWHEASFQLGVGDRMRVRRMRQDGTFAWPADIVALEYRDGFVGGTGGFALLPGGELAIAATSVGYDTTDQDIHGQVIDRRGRLKTPSTGVPVCKAPYYQRSPRVFPPSRLPGPDVAAPPGSAQALFIWTDPRLLNGDALFVQGITFTSRPRLDAPATVPEILQGEAIHLELDGDDLASGATVETDESLVVENVTVTPIDPDGPGDRIVVTLRAVAGARVGPHGLVVVNPDGSRATLAEVLRVRLDARRIDLDASGRVDGYDVAVLAAAFGRGRGEPSYSAAADIDGSGQVDGVDLAFIAGRFGQGPTD